MKSLIKWGIVFTIFFSIAIPANSISIPASIPSSNNTVLPGDIQSKIAMLKNISTMKVKDFQKVIGRKMTLKEKISFLILKQKLKPKHKKAGDSPSKGQTAFVFGIGSIVLLILGLFIPYVIIGALVAAIVAIVSGSMAKKADPDDRKAHAGKLMGWITLGLIALLLILVAAIISSWSWG